jgi:hypothetical protein
MEERGSLHLRELRLGSLQDGMSPSAFSQTARGLHDGRPIPAQLISPEPARSGPRTDDNKHGRPNQKAYPLAGNLESASVGIATTWAKLVHAANAITLRCGDGFRTAISRKIPSAT